MKSNRLVLSIAAITVLLMLAVSASCDDDEMSNRFYSGGYSSDFFSMWGGVPTLDSDMVRLEFRNGTIGVQYTKNETGIRPPDWTLNLSFEEILEFKDNGNGLFDNADSVVSRINISGVNYTLTTPFRDQQPGVTVLSAFNNYGHIEISFVIAEMPYRYFDSYPGNYTVHRTTEFLLVVVLSGEGSRNATDSIGLRMSISTSPGLSTDFDSGSQESAVNLSKSGMGGYLRWPNAARVGGSWGWPVGSSWDGSDLVLSYPNGIGVQHTLHLGFVSWTPPPDWEPEQTIENKTSTEWFGVGLVIAAVVVAVAATITVSWHRKIKLRGQ